ncbi:bifunctional aspartate kinase/homoserine dehydrogenase I [Bacteroidota bacterium]
MKVLKFGGSSVGSPEIILEVKKIIENLQEQSIVVVSAFKGITDQLIRLSSLASQRDELYTTELTEIEKRHCEVIEKIVPQDEKGVVKAKIKNMITDLHDILHGVYLLKELSLKSQDYILSFGERLSATIISKVIKNAEFIDSREIIRTDNNFSNAHVDFKITNEIINKRFKGFDKTIILPGFIASSENDETTTLGRGGSDYTAAIVAAAINASQLEIWTDVSGFMTADPRKVDKAYPIKHLTYAEAMELSHFGAKVIYTPTIQPVYKKNIPVVVKNTYSPMDEGTTISDQPDKDAPSPIKGISSIDEIDLITLQGAGMVGVMGTSMRLFGCLAKHKVNIILITQASSEYSITFAVNPKDSGIAEKAIKEEFKIEIELQNVLNIRIEKHLSVIAIVGEKMKNTPGISANLFRSLGQNGINIVAIAQGSSELNISVVVEKSSLQKSLNAIHEGFFLSRFKELHLFIAGIGTVGKNLIEQIINQQEHLQKEHQLKINVSGITRSTKMIFNKDGLDISNYRELLEKDGQQANIKEYVKQIASYNLRNSVFVDCTADDNIAKTYKDLLNSYVSVVTANKIACSSSYDAYKDLKDTAKKKGMKFIFETNVGAGLPIINTMNDLIKSGDHIIGMEAVLSGTLNFIFNVLSAEIPLSKAIKLAKEKGYSEPDPRIDLSGTDVVRKLLILARESGYKLEQKDVKINSFLPADCFEGSIDDFWKKVEKFDNEFETNRQKLEKENKKWRFVASFDKGKAKIELVTVDREHPAYYLEGSNNIIILTTERYKELPMVIKGYGAGAEVTAAGVFADIIRIANI